MIEGRAQLSRELVQFEKDCRWGSDEYDEIKEKFRGKYVLIKDSHIVISANTMEEIRENAKRLNIDLEKAVVEFIPFKDVVMII